MSAPSQTVLASVVALLRAACEQVIGTSECCLVARCHNPSERQAGLVPGADAIAWLGTGSVAAWLRPAVLSCVLPVLQDCHRGEHIQ